MCGIFGPSPRFQKAGELGLPVGVMPFKGLSQHIDDLEDGWLDGRDVVGNFYLARR